MRWIVDTLPGESGVCTIPGAEGVPMGKTYKVYRVDYLTRMKIPIGTVTERRSQPRGAAGHLGLMKLARQIFAQSPEDQIRIIVGEEQVA